MKQAIQFFVGLFFATIAVAALALNPGDENIMKASDQWAQAIAGRDPNKITALYDKDALLYATFNNYIDTQAGILQYFKKLTKHDNLKVIFTKQNIRVFGDVALNSGMYEFSYTEKGKTVRVPGRFTFVYRDTPVGWIIIDHHSSVMPENK